MRLQCPICDAEYEVDASAIPYEGREVQCSNCGHSWFQNHPDAKTDYALESSLYDPPPPMPQEVEAASTLPKRELDPQVLQILREEVALEAAKRAAENGSTPSGGLLNAADEKEGGQDSDASPKDFAAPAPAQSAPDTAIEVRPPVLPSLPLRVENQATAERLVARRVAGLGRPAGESERGSPNDAEPDPAHELLRAEWTGDVGRPDGASKNRGAMDATPDAKGATSKGSIGRSAGFYTAVLISFLGLSIYILAPELANLQPELAPILEKYVSFVNDLRDQIQLAVPAALETGRAVIAQITAWLAAQGWL